MGCLLEWIVLGCLCPLWRWWEGDLGSQCGIKPANLVARERSCHLWPGMLLPDDNGSQRYDYIPGVTLDRSSGLLSLSIYLLSVCVVPGTAWDVSSSGSSWVVCVHSGGGGRGIWVPSVALSQLIWSRENGAAICDQVCCYQMITEARDTITFPGWP